MNSLISNLYMKLSLIIILLITAFSLAAQTVPPPPPAPPSPDLSNAVSSEEISGDTVVKESVFSFLKDIQLKGTTFIKHQLDSLRDGFTIKTFLIITLFSLAYGIFHTLGPGHGKLIVVSFFLRDSTTKADAFSLSVIVSVIHSSAAIILAILFQSILSSVKGLAQVKVQNGFTLFSGVLIFALGVVYLIMHIRGKDHHSGQVKQVSYEETGKQGRWKRNLAVGLSIGIVPCPLSLTIMMLSIVYGIFWIGISSVISLTIAMVIVLYLLSVYTIKSRDIVEHGKERKGFTVLLNYAGNIALIFLGSYFIYKGGIALF
ncbi:MAG: sulfite exporter TauE/SafE family protein [Spirochaetales bacterium]|nr:sulfite exporter TauE/SafE family protein [Spirochaetales bacterium]